MIKRGKNKYTNHKYGVRVHGEAGGRSCIDCLLLLSH